MKNRYENTTIFQLSYRTFTIFETFFCLNKIFSVPQNFTDTVVSSEKYTNTNQVLDNDYHP